MLTIQKRGIHSSSINNNSLIKNRKEIKSNLDYLNPLEDYLKTGKYEPRKAQEILESSWLESIKSKLEDDKFIKERYSHKLLNVVKEAARSLDILSKQRSFKRRFPHFYQELNKMEYILLTFAFVITYNERYNATMLSVTLGETILFKVFKNLKLDNQSIDASQEDKLKGTFKEFKNELKYDSKKFVILGDLFIQLLSQYPHNIFYRDYNQKDYDQEGLSIAATFKINSDYLDEVRNNLVLPPNTLPMLCEPNKWSDNNYGGFLENDIQGIDLVSGEGKHKHKIENRESLYTAVNITSQIKFEINKDLLHYLNNEGNYLLEIQNELQRNITMKIAEVYSKHPFYLNTHADWRGRIYSPSFFLTYQGNDLSSALINFHIGESINEDGRYYLKIFGANNHNQNNISKESYITRINWVCDNYQKFINLDPDLILSAENKFTFAAFCLNMRNLHNDPSFVIKTPVFLDATCSGIQHLAALMQDIELGVPVNLTPYKEDEKPGDIYSELIPPINEAINKFGDESVEHSTLSLVKLDRKILKQSIMTKVYNVSNFGISEQLKSKLQSVKITDTIEEELKSNLKSNKWGLFLAPGKDNRIIPLTSSNIFKLLKLLMIRYS